MQSAVLLVAADTTSLEVLEQEIRKRPVLKILCPHCGRSVPALDFFTTNRGLTLRCPSCHETSFLEQPRGSTQAEPAGETQCPRCLRTIRAGSVSCPKCGLIFSLWEKGLARIQDAEAETGSADPEAEGLWNRIIRDPGDNTAHEDFLIHCRSHRCLDLAARRYQTFLYHSPKSRLAGMYRDRIIVLAQLEQQPVRRTPSPSRRFNGIKLVLCLGVVSLLWGLVMARLLLVR